MNQPNVYEIVVPAEEMDDETFYKHYNARHLSDLGITNELHPHGEGSTATPSLRAYHDKCHLDGDVIFNSESLNYDHIHE